MLALLSLPTSIKILVGFILAAIGGYMAFANQQTGGWLLLIAGFWIVIGSLLRSDDPKKPQA